MLLNKLKLIFFFIQTINQSICDVDLSNITCKDLKELKKDYKHIMGLKLKDHSYYRSLKMDKMVCPVPWSRLVSHKEVPYENIDIIDRSLSDMVDQCLNYEHCALGYAIILNVVESMGITYIYRFCEFAREMNKKGATISNQLKQFSGNLTKLISIFNRDWISSDSYECILDVYKNHKSEEYNFNEENENYRNDLLGCMHLMKDKVHFVNEPRVESMNNMSINKLRITQRYDNNIISMLINLDSYYPFLKNITGDIYQSSCTFCENKKLSGQVDNIHFFIPCGHGWCCETCSEKIKTCHVCYETITRTQELNIITPASIIETAYRYLMPRCVFDQREARCISCFKQIKDVQPSKKYIKIPCGHGWYCNNCISQNGCLACNETIIDVMCVNL
ncbi:uncharacterized protein LOC126894374 [Daktulosphaira vitifoliae]|uniref:uncharacterized protein LOC126894374 n=1 Tax=Daktulosphaira vitifoliae TaxID=58002 RepID=UPI0021AAF932|nr:uncharacterized protein LOC126894374 [Daktulosphaira vitifoliae]